MSSDELQDSFRVLGLSISATDVDIRKAYRKLSLRYHPDKAGPDVDPILAADRFHKINFAYETLMDPAARARAQQKATEDAAKRERQDKYEGKRRQMADDLERSEQEAIFRKNDLLRRTRERQEKIGKLKEEARKMVAQKQATIRNQHRQELTAAQQQSARAQEELGPALQPLDKTVRIRYPSSQISQATGSASDSFSAPSAPLYTPLASALTSQFGPLEHLQFQLPSSGKRVKRELTILASFAHLKDAWRAVMTGGDMRATGLLEDAYIGWASFEEKKNADGSKDKLYVAPQRVQWYIRRGITDPSDIQREAELIQNTSTRRRERILTVEYENATLQRMLDAEQRHTQTPVV